MIYAFADGVQLFLNGAVQRIGEVKAVGLIAQTDNLGSQSLAALAALCPDLGQSDIDTQLVALGLDQIQLSLGVGGECVDRDNAGQAKDGLHVIDVLQQVGQTLFQSLQVLVVQVGLGHAAVVLEGADSCNDDNGGGLQTCHAAFNVDEFLGA